MHVPAPSPKKPGRNSTIATHPRRVEIELARASGTSLQKIAAEFGVGRGSVDRHWRSLSPTYRSRLIELEEAHRSFRARIRQTFAILGAERDAEMSQQESQRPAREGLGTASITFPHHAQRPVQKLWAAADISASGATMSCSHG